MNQPFLKPNEVVVSTDAAKLLHGGGFAYHLFNNSPDCLKILDLDGRLVLMNAGGLVAMEIENVVPLLGCAWIDFWGTDSPVVEAAMDQARAGGIGRFTLECPTLKGTPKWWDVIVSPIAGPDGKPTQLLAVSRDVTADREMQAEHKALVHELEHRMKNMLAVVQSLAYQSFREGNPIGPSRDSFVARLSTLSRTYDLLAGERWTGTGLQAVIEAALLPYHLGAEQLVIGGPHLHLSAQSATSFALALNELAANAAKYGALSSTTGRLDIVWTVAEGIFTFTWRESGGPPVEPPVKRGFGRRLVEFSLPSQFQGELRYEFLPTGVELTLTAPASAVEAS